MRCTRFRHKTDKLLDGALDTQAAARLQVHLEKCNACRQYYQEGLKLKELLLAQPNSEFPTWLHHRILDQCRAHETRRSVYQKRLRFQLVPAVLAVMVSLFLGSLVGKTAFETQYQSTQETEQKSELSFGEVFLVDQDNYPELINE